MSKRFVAKTYRNRRVLRIILAAVIFAALALVVTFLLLFFMLDDYVVPNTDRHTVRIEHPFFTHEPPTD